ncbi:MAG: hypothetical protein JSV00_05190 [bacterium]|nr:MAG: hypothetical protein JSV00_05190 [bacterium]
MIPSGIYVKTQLEELAEELPLRIEAATPVKVGRNIPHSSAVPEAGAVLHLSRWAEGWCHIEVAGDSEGVTVVVESLVGREAVGEVFVCHWEPSTGEYGYTFFRGGKLLEQFGVKGPALESVNFVSEVRRVDLQELIRAPDFMKTALQYFGIPAGTGSPAAERVRHDISLPGKRSFWRTLLGAAYFRK